MSCQQFSTIFSGFFSLETEYSTYEERHQQHPGEVEGRHQQDLAAVGRQRRREVELHNPLASVFVLWNLRFLERDHSYEERHRQHLAVVGERRLQQPVVAAAHLRHQGAELKNFLAWTSVSELVVSEESFTYEGQHRQGLVVVEGRRLQQLEEEGRVLLRVVAGLNISLASVFFPWNLRFPEREYSYEQRHRQGLAAGEGRRLCSSLRRRQEEEEEGLQPGVVAGLLLLLVAVVVAGHLRRRQEVCKVQSRLSVGVG